MSLESGTRLGPYEVLALIGAGGMGEVYKARDTRLDRIVAVKVSKDEFSERFSREARNVAALNHPNICTLHDVGPNYLVMEFVEGETLSGPLPIDTCIHYGRQIIEAIEAAHEKAIIHRDLKPANIKVTPEGTIKVLDFGLAKALDSDVSSAPGPDSPTLSMTMTRAGMILGTAAYMSPEQAKGKQADRRADIWAFGVVLYEMLTGKQAFTGETAAETLASVMMAQLPLDRLPDTTPPALRQVITRCLERDVRRRLQAIGEARIILESSPTQTEVPTKARTRRTWIPWTIAAVLLVALVAAMAWILKPAASPIVTRFPISLGEGQQYSIATNRLLVAISSDGTQIVYAANNKLYLRSMPDLVARPIPGSESVGGLAASPAFSPDGKSLVFYAASEQNLKRVAVSGGAAVTLCPIGGPPFGVSWTGEGILYARGKEIFRVSENGGKPEVLIAANEGERITQPQMLPGGKAVLYTVGRDSGTTDWDKAQVVVQELKSGPRKLLVDGGSDGRYLPTGHLVYALSGVLFAQSFDLGRMTLHGSPVSILEGVTRGASGNANFTVSDTGSLVYVPGPAAAGLQGSLLLARVDLQGNAEPLKAPPATYAVPRVSPDGKRIAYGIDDGKEANIGIYDVAGTNAPRPITFGGANRFPIWASNERVAFQSEREGDVGIWWTRADGTGTAERLTKPEKGAVHTPDSWSPDGRFFLYSVNGNGASSLWVYSIKDKKSSPIAEVPQGGAAKGVFSPDGHWVAYQVLESGENRMYVQPFPPTGAKYRVPQDGNNHHAVWSQPDGATLFFVPGNARLDSVSFTTRPSPAFGPPTPMPKGAGFITQQPVSVRSYDIFPDGKHFIGVVGVGRVQPEGAQASPQFQVVLNWFQELKQRVPNR